MPFLLAGAGLVILLAVVSQRRKGVARPRAMNHHGKLVKEVMKAVPLRPAELRQLKVLVEDVGGSAPPTSPLTLVLCPSLLAKSIRSRQARRAKLDRKVVSRLARKVGVTREMLEERKGGSGSRDGQPAGANAQGPEGPRSLTRSLTRSRDRQGAV